MNPIKAMSFYIDDITVSSNRTHFYAAKAEQSIKVDNHGPTRRPRLARRVSTSDLIY